MSMMLILHCGDGDGVDQLVNKQNYRSVMAYWFTIMFYDGQLVQAYERRDLAQGSKSVEHGADGKSSRAWFFDGLSLTICWSQYWSFKQSKYLLSNEVMLNQYVV